MSVRHNFFFVYCHFEILPKLVLLIMQLQYEYTPVITTYFLDFQLRNMVMFIPQAGLTALDMARTAGHTEVCQELLNHSS